MNEWFLSLAQRFAWPAPIIAIKVRILLSTRGEILKIADVRSVLYKRIPQKDLSSDVFRLISKPSRKSSLH